MCDCTTPTMKLTDTGVSFSEIPEKIHYKTLPKKLHKYIEFTFNEAFTNEGMAQAKIAAMIIHRGKPIAIGHNSTKTHPMQVKYGKNNAAIYIHAEIDAIRRASAFLSLNDFSKATMIVMRAKKDKSWGLARPCVFHNKQGCQAAIAAFGIKNVIYSTSENEMVSYL